MNFKKSIAAIAATAITASACAFSASAFVAEGSTTDAEGKDLVIVNEGMWLAIPYNNGERNETVLADKNKAIVDYGIDWDQAGSIEVIVHVTPDTYEDFADENNFGGAIVLGSNAAGDSSHNWNAKEWYGVNDDALEFTAESAKELQAEKIGDYMYKIVCPVDSTNSVVDNAQMVQIAVQHYNTNTVWYSIAVDSVKVFDKTGSLLIGWDGPTGKVEIASSSAPAAAEEDTAPATVTGNVDAATDSSKGSPDTGIADVAAVAGVAVLAAGAFVVAKKRK